MTISTLRPQLDYREIGLTLSTGVDSWALLDDGGNVTDFSGADDTTYVRVVAGQQYPNGLLTVYMTDLTGFNPATQRIKALRIRARIRMNSAVAGDAALIHMSLQDYGTPTGQQRAGGIDVFQTGSTTVQNRTGTWKAQPPPSDGSEWTLAVVNRIRLQAVWYYGDFGSENLRLTEAYVDVDVRSQASVSGVDAINEATTTRPTIVWAFTSNADNDPQSAYRVKVFTPAQYGIAGFNPETSPSTWDSGTRAGAGEELTVGKDLAPGGTYRAYVKGAIDFNGSNWFTAWANSADFTVTPAPPPAPTLLVTADPTLPYYRNVIRVQGFVNLLTGQQSSLEDTTTTGWFAGQNTTIANTGAQFADGVRALQLTKTVSTGTAFANTPAADAGQGAAILIRPGQQYTAVASFRAAVTGRQARVRIAFYQHDNTFVSDALGSLITDTTSGWTQATVTATAPANAAQATVELQVGNGLAAINEVHYADKIGLWPGAGTVWSYGGGVAADGTGPGYLVVERNWASVHPVNLLHPQLWSAGDLNQDTSGFFTDTASFLTYDPAERHHGQGAIRWEVLGTGSSLFVGWPAGTVADRAPAYALPGVPARSYTFSVWAKASQSFTSNLTLRALDKDGVSLGTAAGAITITTSWQQFTRTYTLPAGTVWVRPELLNSGAVTGRQVWVDELQWELGSAASTLAQPGGQSAEWFGVRGAAEFAAPGQGQLFLPVRDEAITIFDHEVPAGYTVTYRARVVTYNSAGEPVASVDSPYVQTILDAPAPRSYILGSVSEPLYRMVPKVLALDESRHEEVSVYYPLRPDAPEPFGPHSVAIADFVGGVDTQLVVASTSEDEYLLLTHILARGSVLWLVYPDFGGRYYRVTGQAWPRRSIPPDPSVCPAPQRRWYREFSLPVVQVGPPP